MSVVIPAHNAAGCIGRALRGLASDGEVIKEVLVVDDGSTDDTGRVALETGETLSLPVTVLRAESRDAGAARNIGLAEVSAPWVYLQDADDQLVAGGLRRLVARAHQVPEADLVAGGYIRFVDGARKSRKAPGRYGSQGIDNVKRYLANRVASIAIGSVLVKHAAIGDTRFQPGLPYDEDTLFLLEIMARTNIVTISETVLTYFVSSKRADHRFVAAPARDFLTWRRAFLGLEHCGIPRQALKVRNGIVAMKIARVHYARGDLDTADRFLSIARAAPTAKAADWWRLVRYAAKISVRQRLKRAIR